MLTYQVQTGDTLSQIAKKLNVPMESISGYRSGDPSLIFPGENLTVGQPSGQPINQQGQNIQQQPVDINAALATGGLQLDQQPQTPVQAPLGVGQPQGQQPPTGASNVTLTPPQPPTQRTIATPSGRQVRLPVSAETDALLGEQQNAQQPQAETFFQQYGVPTEALQTGFQMNPSQTVSDLVRLVMEATGLPDVRSNVANISKEIEDLENQRDKEIEDIQDNPWKSVGSKSQLIDRINNQYENRIKNRVNRLTLLQGAYDDARQQAQFAATTAINLYDRNRTFDQNKLEFVLNRAEKAADAERKLSTPIEVSAGATLFDQRTGKPIYTAPQKGTGTPSGVRTGVSGQYQGAIDTILGSQKFTEQQRASVIEAINNGEDPATVIKNQAKNIMGQTQANKVENFEIAQAQVKDLDALLNQYYSLGGTTGLLKGSYEKTVNKLGEVREPKLVEISTQISAALQIYRNAVSGTAYSVQEGADIASIFPGINKSEGLNKAILNGRLKAFDSTIDGAYRATLGKAYDSIKAPDRTADSLVPKPDISKEIGDISFKAPSSWQSFLNKIFD